MGEGLNEGACGHGDMWPRGCAAAFGREWGTWCRPNMDGVFAQSPIPNPPFYCPLPLSVTFRSLPLWQADFVVDPKKRGDGFGGPRGEAIDEFVAVPGDDLGFDLERRFAALRG